MDEETRSYLLSSGQTLNVTVDRLARRVVFVVSGGDSFRMHIRQAYHLAKFLFGIKPAHGDEEDHRQAYHLARFLAGIEPTEDGHRPSGDDDDTKPIRRPLDDLDLSDQDNDPD